VVNQWLSHIHAIMFQFFKQKSWAKWSIFGSLIIFAAIWAQVNIDLAINRWFGEFYNAIQKILTAPGSVPLNEYYRLLMSFIHLALIGITIAVLLDFFTKHYIFRWRTSMNDHYMSPANWQRLRTTEGAAQRVQEDTRLFARIMETLGVELVRSIFTLVAFLPLLWTLSTHIKALPWIGPIHHGLVYVALIFALLGTVGLALLGFKLPGLEYKNQVVEARYRKELVHAEDDKHRAQPPTVASLYNDIRKNYFRLFFHYLYFDVGKWSYLQSSVIMSYVAMGPSIISGALTLGLMQQIVRAFDRVQTSFQYLVNQWVVIVELISVWKRLLEFERQLHACDASTAKYSSE
jgi:peptide/bleomycin uptake transporter